MGQDMRLELKNIGKIRQAQIDLNGITVIAGENNTGKSTVGKMLYSVFHTFYKIEEQVQLERRKSVHRALYSFYHEFPGTAVRRLDINTLAKGIVDRKEEFLGDTRILEKEIQEYFLNQNRDLEPYLQQEALEKLAERIYMIIEMDAAEIRKIILHKHLEEEFAMKVAHLNHVEDEATVKLNIKDQIIDFCVVRNEELRIFNYINLVKEVIYMDDPFVLDELEDLNWRIFSSEYAHRADLIEKLSKEKVSSDFSLVDELIAKKKLDRILSVINDVCDGEIKSVEGNRFVYQTERLSDSLDMVNLSTGIKSFSILRRLLQNGSIDENGIIILDEPEIHLHPEWQLKFAEIIVLVQKEFETNILLNTHSPYFLNAIEVYSQRYGIEGKCAYYLANEVDNETNIENVTNNTEKIYEKLARPLQDLENMEYGDGNTAI